MPTFSLDWNCAISVENGEASSSDILQLVSAHKQKRVDVAVLQTSASENMKGSRSFPSSYINFEKRLSALGWTDLPRVPTPGVWGLTFWDQCFYVDEVQYGSRISAIWSGVFPNIPQDFGAYLAQRGFSANMNLSSAPASKWRNAWCDVHSAYSHLHAGRDYFVSLNTNDFKGPAVAALGLRALTPTEAIALV